MRIQLHSIFGLEAIKAFGGDEVEIEADEITLKTFLLMLTRQSGETIKLIDPQTGDISGDYFVVINGRDCQSLVHGLETELRDGDEVSIGPIDLVFSGG